MGAECLRDGYEEVNPGTVSEQAKSLASPTFSNFRYWIRGKNLSPTGEREN